MNEKLLSNKLRQNYELKIKSFLWLGILCGRASVLFQWDAAALGIKTRIPPCSNRFAGWQGGIVMGWGGIC